jgi:2-oxoglutarate ferredoxin oxidoreductase subunit beta
LGVVPFDVTLRTEREPPWCAGCGHFAALDSLDRALTTLGISEERLAIVAAPGCTGWVADALHGSRLEAPPGMALAVALGTHLARRDARVIAVAGDTDAFVTGAAQLAAVAARQPRIAYVILDNGIPAWWGRATSQPHVRERKPGVAIALEAGARFVGQALASDSESVDSLLRAAFEAPGLAVAVVKTACVAFNAEEGDPWLRERCRPVPADHDRANREAALALAADASTIHSGVLFESETS